MSFQNLTNALLNFIEEHFIGKLCPSGLSHGVRHRIPYSQWTTFPIPKCDHPDCVLFRDLDELKALRGITSNIRVEGLPSETFPGDCPMPAINKINAIINQLEALNESIEALQDYSHKAFKHGCVHGVNMERKRLFETLQNSKQLLLDTISNIGVNETRVPQFVSWYETTRDSSMNPRQDIITYRTCKNILELNTAMVELQQEDVQLT